jgi:putative membrane protein
MIKSEWKSIFKNQKMLISIIAVLFIPVMYAGMFLWAFWDPTGNASNLPVAVVNLDEGAEYNGTELKLGQELSDKLIKSKELNFISVSAEEADQGLLDQDYYLLIEIPENFSQHSTTLLDENPQKMVITYKPNEGYNFFSSQIGETAIKKIRLEVNEQVSATYAEQLFDSISELGDGFEEASDGAGELKDGATEIGTGVSNLQGYLEQLASSTIELRDGTDIVAEGIQSAATGTSELNKGLSQLEDGSIQLVDGVTQSASGASSLQSGIQAYTSGVSKLSESYALLGEKEQALLDSLARTERGSVTLNESTAQLSQGSTSVTAGIQALAEQMIQITATLPAEQATALTTTLQELEAGSTSVSNGLLQLAAGTEELSTATAQIGSGAEQLSEGYAQAQQGVDELNGSSTALIDGASSLATGTNTLAVKMNEFNTGIQEAHAGSSSLVNGLNQLASGSSELTEGTGTLAEKSGEIAKGTSELVDGTNQLVDGTDTLQTSLKDGSSQAGEVSASDKTYEMVASPVEVNTEEVNVVPNYGTGFTPYFLSLGLFVGALMFSIVFPFVETTMKPLNGASWFASKVSVFAVAGFIQSLIVVLVALFVLKVEVQSVGLFALSALIASFTFFAIIQFLISVFGDPGRFIALILLIIQLTSSAGTYPLELIPEQLQIFNKYLPMTYTIQSFKASVSTGDMGQYWYSNGVLLGFMVTFLMLTLAYFMIVFKKRYSKEVPTEA